MGSTLSGCSSVLVGHALPAVPAAAPPTCRMSSGGPFTLQKYRELPVWTAYLPLSLVPGVGLGMLAVLRLQAVLIG